MSVLARVSIGIVLAGLLIQLIPYGHERTNPAVVREPAWAPAIRRMAAGLDPARRPVALAAVVIGP